MAKRALKIMGSSYRKIFKVCLAILKHYARKGQMIKTYFSELSGKCS